MSFRIEVIAHPGFRYDRDDCADGGLFELAAVLSAVRASGPSAQGAVEGVLDYVVPSMESQARENIDAHLDTITRQHMLEGLEFLASCNHVRQGAWISVVVYDEGWFSTESLGIAVYNFSPLQDVRSEFVQSVCPMLDDTGMNRWGVLFQMDIAMRRYYTERLHGQGRPMMQIYLFK